ncbi:hypothetical protein ABL78_0491 [Leptomonas seymouri]|uniref:WW domain-containing protein n=1 Tax=Leptomonas seymouri TaxID=5684 RepID=A0A0N1IA79_LEPSE|nr:hypothetical protein ABL78_0491 [Leptomonas seymouri]|eukprot:KPI90415.1 hypothetical protein ABL78_0491 [Leptomonas seymouri]
MASATRQPDLSLPHHSNASKATDDTLYTTFKNEEDCTFTTCGGESDSFALSTDTTTASPLSDGVAVQLPQQQQRSEHHHSEHHHHHTHHHTHHHRSLKSRSNSNVTLSTADYSPDSKGDGDDYAEIRIVRMLPGSSTRECTNAGNSSSSSSCGSSGGERGTTASTPSAVNTSPSQNAAASGSTRVAQKRVPSTTTAAAAMAANARSSPPSFIGSGGTSSPLCGSGSPLPSTGCVRWCMNVALQSFTGEPWAVTLQPAAEDDFVLNGSFPGSLADSPVLSPAAPPAHSAATTTTAAANNIRQQPLPGANAGTSNASNSGSNRSSPVHGAGATRMSPSMLRSGLQLAAIDYSEPQVQYLGGPVLDASMFGYDPQSEDIAALHQCVLAVNSPPVTYGVDDLLGRITNVEFIAEQSSPEETAAGVPMHYRLASSLEPMLNATLNPAIAAVVDHCVSAMVLVYGATQEMKQMGLIGTPEECGLLPHGIRIMMDRFLERKEHQQSKASSANGSPKSPGEKAGGAQQALASPPLKPSGSRSPPQGGGDDAASDGDRTEGGHSRSATSHAYSFVFPSIGSRHHRFVRMESTFIAFDSTSVVDLLDLSNKRVELVLKLAPPPTPSAFEEKADDVNAPSSSSATTDSFVLNARAMPVENTNDALSALDVGLENLSRALELSLLQSESGSSLLFSLTAFTDTCRCATMHVLCLAEDPAAQTWLASTVQARSQAIPLGEEQSWASIQNTPMPPPLHHHAATMLVPALCFGNMFTSVLICVYNSITALSRLNRDLTFAVTGYRMRTIPRVTLASSRRGLKKLPPSWEEYFTNDGRRYFIDTTTQTTTWEDPRFTYQQRPSRSGSSPGGSPGGGSSASSSRGGAPQRRPSRIGLSNGDKDFLANRLQQELHSGGSSSSSTVGGSPPTVTAKGSSKAQVSRGVAAAAGVNTAAPGDEPLDIGIVVVDTMCRPRVLISSSNPRFAQQYTEQEKILRVKQIELEESMAAMRREAEKNRINAAAAMTASSQAAPTVLSFSGGADDTDPDVVPVTATPSECVQTIADPAAPVRSSDLNDTSPSPVSGLIGLDDVDDEEVSSLCRSNSGNVDDFIFDSDSDDDDDSGKKMRVKLRSPAGTSAGPTPSASAGDGNGGGHTRACNESDVGGINAEARFYANALQEQAVGVIEMTANATTPLSNSSVTAASLIGSASVSVVPEEQCAGVTAEPGVPSSVLASVPPEVQDLESLVDEFTAFYRKAYLMQQRIAELEAKDKMRKAASWSDSAQVLSPCVAAEDASSTFDILQEMQKAVAASPSVEIQKAVLPLLSASGNADSKDRDNSGAIVAAFQEALRLAAQSSISAEKL